MRETICFRVVKEPYGWAVRVGEGMMTPFSSRGPAIEHANGFASALRRSGERVEVVVEEVSFLPARRASPGNLRPSSTTRDGGSGGSWQSER
jgi:hypothetical protein